MIINTAIILYRTKCREWKTVEYSVINGTCILQPFHERIAFIAEQGTESTRDTRLQGNGVFWTQQGTCTSDLTVSGTLCIQPVKTHISRNPSKGRKVEYDVPPRMEESLVVTSWEKEWWVYSKILATDMRIKLQGRPHS